MDLKGVILEHLQRGQKGALAVIVNKEGSAPRDRGAQMFVASDGKAFGTVGGGSVEAEVLRQAMEVIETGLHRVLHVSMDGKDADDVDMICGGNVDIFIEPVGEDQKEVYEAVRNAIKRGMTGFLITRYSDAGLLKTFLGRDGTAVGAPIDTETTTLLSGAGERHLFLEGLIAVPIRITSPLYIFGAGHVSQCISRIAAMVDFEVTVIDDRADYSNAARFPEAKSTIADNFGVVFDYLPFSGSEYVVIVTRGHKHDMAVLEQALKQPTRYLGMIGSRRKTLMIFDHLRKSGIDGEHLAGVCAPIGLDIGAETPQEIAVSIVAQLIETRRCGAACPAFGGPNGKTHPTEHASRHLDHKVLFG